MGVVGRANSVKIVINESLKQNKIYLFNSEVFYLIYMRDFQFSM